MKILLAYFLYPLPYQRRGVSKAVAAPSEPKERAVIWAHVADIFRKGIKPLLSLSSSPSKP